MGGDIEEDEERRRPEPPPVEFVRPGEAAAPLPPRDQPPAAWVPRPEDYFRPAAPPAPTFGAAGQLHVIAGILLVASALVAMGWTIALSIEFLSPSEYENLTANVTSGEWAAAQVCGLVGIWGQAVALLAGAMAFLRLNWRFAVSCAIVSILTIGGTALLFGQLPFAAAGALGIGGVALLSRARREFHS